MNSEVYRLIIANPRIKTKKWARKFIERFIKTYNRHESRLFLSGIIEKIDDVTLEEDIIPFKNRCLVVSSDTSFYPLEEYINLKYENLIGRWIAWVKIKC